MDSNRHTCSSDSIPHKATHGGGKVRSTSLAMLPAVQSTEKRDGDWFGEEGEYESGMEATTKFALSAQTTLPFTVDFFGESDMYAEDSVRDIPSHCANPPPDSPVYPLCRKDEKPQAKLQATSAKPHSSASNATDQIAPSPNTNTLPSIFSSPVKDSLLSASTYDTSFTASCMNMESAYSIYDSGKQRQTVGSENTYIGLTPCDKPVPSTSNDTSCTSVVVWPGFQNQSKPVTQDMMLSATGVVPPGFHKRGSTVSSVMSDTSLHDPFSWDEAVNNDERCHSRSSNAGESSKVSKSSKSKASKPPSAFKTRKGNANSIQGLPDSNRVGNALETKSKQGEGASTVSPAPADAKSLADTSPDMPATCVAHNAKDQALTDTYTLMAMTHFAAQQDSQSSVMSGGRMAQKQTTNDDQNKVSASNAKPGLLSQPDSQDAHHHYSTVNVSKKTSSMTMTPSLVELEGGVKGNDWCGEQTSTSCVVKADAASTLAVDSRKSDKIYSECKPKKVTSSLKHSPPSQPPIYTLPHKGGTTGARPESADHGPLNISTSSLESQVSVQGSGTLRQAHSKLLNASNFHDVACLESEADLACRLPPASQLPTNTGHYSEATGVSSQGTINTKFSSQLVHDDQAISPPLPKANVVPQIAKDRAVSSPRVPVANSVSRLSLDAARYADAETFLSHMSRQAPSSARKPARVATSNATNELITDASQIHTTGDTATISAPPAAISKLQSELWSVSELVTVDLAKEEVKHAQRLRSSSQVPEQGVRYTNSNTFMSEISKYAAENARAKTPGKSAQHVGQGSAPN